MLLNKTGAFIVPHYNNGNEKELKWFEEALNSIKLQTDNNWKIIVIDDASTSEKAIRFLKQIKKEFSGKMEIIFLSKNLGSGNARNIGIKRAFELGCPFVLYLDQDDISHPERLAVTREIFNREQETGVVYSTFQVIDDNSNIVPKNKIMPSIQEILDSHVNNPPQGKNVWIRIAIETGYVNLTSSTSVRTDVALRRPFPIERVSEDYYTWLVYSAAGYQFVYTPLIPSGYRIPQNVNGSRSRNFMGGTHTFNMIKSIIDMRSIQAAADIAYRSGDFTDKQIKEIKVRFCLRKSESMAIDGEKAIAEDYIYRAKDIDNELTEKILKKRKVCFMAVLLTNSVATNGINKTVQMLNRNVSSLDAIESGIRLVESDPDAGWVGYGGHPNLLGTVELDAGIMDGLTLNAGAVGALSGYLHPISVARNVMEKLPHVFLAGKGAAKFAKDINAESGNNLTMRTYKEWTNWLNINRDLTELNNWPDINLIRLSRLTANNKTAKGTTVFLAQDNDGNFSVGSSTSGWSFKYPGRLGDSPVIGSGIYADNRYGVAACTGMGELTLRSNTARSVILYLKMNMELKEACYEALNDLRAIKTDFRGGVTIYALDAKGNRFVLSVRALDKGLPECDTYYWYWDNQYYEPVKINAVMENW